MEFLMSETKVYAILTAGYDRKERMEGRILGEELKLEVCSVLSKKSGKICSSLSSAAMREIFLYNRKVRHHAQRNP